MRNDLADNGLSAFLPAGRKAAVRHGQSFTRVIPCFVVTLTGGGAAGGRGFDYREVSSEERHVWSTSAVAHRLAAFDARDWNDVVALCQQPSEGDLRIRNAMPSCHFGNSIDDCQVLWHVLGRVTGIVAARAAFRSLLSKVARRNPLTDSAEARFAKHGRCVTSFTAAERRRAPAHGRRAMLRDKTILIVEDNVFLAVDLSSAVEELAGRVAGPVATASEALRLLGSDQIMGAVLDCDLVEVDVAQIVMQLAERDIPVVIHSTAGPPPDVINILPHAPVLMAPVQPEVVLARLIEEISKRTGDD